MKPLFRSTVQKQTHSRSGIAFIIEMLVLLVLVCGCFSVLVEMFAYAQQQGQNNFDKAEAIHLASDVAEAFSADPSAIPAEQIIGDYSIRTSVVDEPQVNGVLYTATIDVFHVRSDSVSDEEPPLYYELKTARYVRVGDQ